MNLTVAVLFVVFGTLLELLKLLKLGSIVGFCRTMQRTISFELIPPNASDVVLARELYIINNAAELRYIVQKICT